MMLKHSVEMWRDIICTNPYSSKLLMADWKKYINEFMRPLPSFDVETNWCPDDLTVYDLREAVYAFGGPSIEKFLGITTMQRNALQAAAFNDVDLRALPEPERYVALHYRIYHYEDEHGESGRL